MGRSDDDYDLVHTYDQAKAGKSKTARPAVRELGRDGAPTRLFIAEQRPASSVADPPAGVRYIFVDPAGDLRRKNPDGTDELAVPTAPTDASYLTVDSEPDLTDERQVTTSSRVTVTDSGPDSTAEIDVVEGQIEAGNLSGATGSDGEVLQTDGSQAFFGPSASGQPDYVEDGNSPFDATGSQVTYNLAGTYDVVQVLVSRFTVDADGAALNLRVNGGQSSTYNYVDGAGNRTVGDQLLNLADGVDADNGYSGPIFFRGDTNSGGEKIAVRPGLAANGRTSHLEYGVNFGVSPPLNSITFLSGDGDVTVKARVYGWRQ